MQTFWINLSLSSDIISIKIYDESFTIAFGLDILKFPFLDSDVLCVTSYGVNIPKRIRLPGAFCQVSDLSI